MRFIACRPASLGADRLALRCIQFSPKQSRTLDSSLCRASLRYHSSTAGARPYLRRTATTSISTRQAGLASPITWNTERVGRFGCSLVPKNCE